ncbi:MAG: CotH kinase family protein [Muribaculaceae bacterium]|nr:CotH kinase family protein [Muribaculaceae bacterium]
MTLNKFIVLVGALSFLYLTSCSDSEPLSPGDDEYKEGSLEVFTTETIKFTNPRESAEIDIQINPANIIFDYNLESTDCQIELGYVNQEEAFNNGSYPCNLTDIKQKTDSNGNIIEGQYTVTLQDKGTNIFKYREDLFLKLNYFDSEGKKVYAISNVFIVEFISESDLLLDTGLPVVLITTPSEIKSKNNWTSDCYIQIVNAGEYNKSYEKVQIKGRGNSTWTYPKKPYAIKLDSKEKVLGMNKHKRWVLLANYIDRTLMRNAVAFEISKKTNLSYTPSGQFVEVIMNGVHIGNYYLCEQIKIDKNRVDITEQEDNLNDDANVTGGYIFELDTNFDEAFKFRSTIFDLPWMFKDPDEVNDNQMNYVIDYVNQMEQEIANIPNSSYTDFLDIDSCIDWWFVHELMMNMEPNHPKSTYFYKDKDDLMKMGPVWDFDWGTLATTTIKSYSIKNAVYFSKLFQDPEFINLVKSKWAEEYGSFLSIPDFIDATAQEIENSNILNYSIWGCPESPNYESSDFQEAVDKIKSSYVAKLAWLNTQILNL